MVLYLRKMSVAQRLRVDLSDKFPRRMTREPEGRRLIALLEASLAQVSIRMTA